jgi:hypothetical protein
MTEKEGEDKRKKRREEMGERIFLMLRDKLSKSNNLQWYRATKISIL